MKRLSRTEIILGALVVLNLLISLWLYQTVQAQDKRIRSLERDDAIKQQVQNLDQQFQNLKSRVKGLIP